MENSVTEAERSSEQSSRCHQHHHHHHHFDRLHDDDDHHHHHQHDFHQHHNDEMMTIMMMITIMLIITTLMMVMKAGEEGSRYRQCCIQNPLHVSPWSDHCTPSSSSSSTLSPSSSSTPFMTLLCIATHWNSLWSSEWTGGLRYDRFSLSPALISYSSPPGDPSIHPQSTYRTTVLHPPLTCYC